MKRRNFLKSIPYTFIPTMVGGSVVQAIANNPFLDALAAPYVDTDHILVLILLEGGNDGLNTVIGLDQYSGYTAVRSNIYIPESKVLKLNGYDKTGLHPAMTGIQNLFNEGKVKIIQGVGYPNPVFSHFRSKDIWYTGSDSNVVINSGWNGRYLQNEYPNYPVGFPNTTMPDPLAIQVGNGALYQNLQVNGVTFGMPTNNPNSIYTNLNTTDTAPNTKAGKELNYLRETAQKTNDYTTKISNAATKSGVTIPNTMNSIDKDLQTVAALIAGGLKTRIYMVSLGGYDTHRGQVVAGATETGTHADKLSNVSIAISNFMTTLKSKGVDERVVGMTFSDFGRRIKSNGSGGTDHGAAAPMFLFGNQVVGGILGDNPTISPNATVEDNIPYQYDFRSVYSSLMKHWFCLPQNEVDTIMFKNFQDLNLVKDSCTTTDTHELNKLAGDSLVTCYPNPFVHSTTIKYVSNGGYCMIEIIDNQGRVIKKLLAKDTPEGIYELDCDLEGYSSGIYYVRFQNGALQQVKSMVKVRG